MHRHLLSRRRLESSCTPGQKPTPFLLATSTFSAAPQTCSKASCKLPLVDSTAFRERCINSRHVRHRYAPARCRTPWRHALAAGPPVVSHCTASSPGHCHRRPAFRLFCDMEAVSPQRKHRGIAVATQPQPHRAGQCVLHCTSHGMAVLIESSVRAIADARPCLRQRASQDAFCSPASVSRRILTNWLHVVCHTSARSRRTSASAVLEA